jgi:REP element-mobilizing transposase RayT
MPQSLSQVYLHIVFSTKHRAPYLNEKPFRERTHAYLAGACHNLESPSIIVGGIEDHVHVLCRQSKNLSIAHLVRELKRESSKWVKAEAPQLCDFYWQQGYGAFSISPAHVDDLKQYIATQEEHHRRESFQDEYRRLLRKYAVAFDERYVWD